MRLDLDNRDVRRGEQPGTRPIRARARPPVQVVLHDLHDKLALSERQLVVFRGLRMEYSGVRARIYVASVSKRNAPRSRIARAPLCLDHHELGLELPPRVRALARARVPARSAA